MATESERLLAELRREMQVGSVGLPAGTELAVARVRDAMASATGLLPVADAAAATIGEMLSAWEITVTLIDGTEYWDIVDICEDPDGYPRFPDYRYRLADFPLGTERMLSGKGYVTGDAADEVLMEFERKWPEVPAGSIMSVPIVALGGVHGELFLVRHQDEPPFTRDDLDLTSELATLLGARLPALVSAYLDSGQHPAGRTSMPTLTDQLNEILNED